MKTVLYDLTPLDTLSRVRGIGRYVRELASGLSRLSNADKGDLRVIGLTRLGWSGEYQITHDIGSFEGSPEVTQPAQADHYRWAYRRRLALFRAVSSIGADVVHLGDPNATPLFMGFSGAKSIVTCHDLIPSRFPERYFSYKDGGPVVGAMIARRRYASADAVVAISDATADDLVRFAGVPRSRIERVYNGVDLERWSAPSAIDALEVAKRHGLGERPFVLYVGDGDWRKNTEGMISGLARARARGIAIDLAWAGKLAPSRIEEIERLAHAAGVGDSVRRLGYVNDDDLRSLYRAARAHLFVSRAEGFGLTVVEAMASGCAVITTRAGSLAEVAGDAALAVDPEDHEAIGDAIARLCQDGSLREDLVRLGRLRASTFSHEAQARAMLSVYRRVAFGEEKTR